MTTSYRGYSWQNITYFPSPEAGWDTDTVPWMLPANSAAALDNFIIRPGNLKLRGPMFHGWQAQDSSTPLGEWSICGWVGSQQGQALRLATALTGSVQPWDQSLVCNSVNWSTAAIQADTKSLTPLSSRRGWATSGAGAYPAGTQPSGRTILLSGTTIGLAGSGTATASNPASTYQVTATSMFTYTDTTTYQKQVRQIAGSVSPASVAFSGSGAAMSGTAATFGVTGPTFPVGNSQTATVGNLGFTIPTGATVVGVEIDVTATANPSSGSSSLPAGTNVHDGTVQLVVGGTAVGNNAVLGGTQNGLTQDPQHVLYGAPQWDNTNVLFWGYPSASLTPAAVNAANFGFAYTFANTGTTTSVLPTVTVNSMTVYFSTGVSALPTAVTAGNAPVGSVDIAQYLNRVWLAQGYDAPGGQASTTHSNTTVFWSNPTTTPPTTAAAWKNPTTGLTNQSRIDNDTTDPIMGFAPLRSVLVVFRRKSVWVLTGTTESNFAFTKITGFQGCLDPRSIQVVDNLAYFVSLTGLQVTDGSSIKNVSGGVQYSMTDAIHAEQASVLNGGAGTTGGFITSAILKGGQYALTIGTATRQNNGTLLYPYHKQTLWAGTFDPQFQAWTRLSSALTNDNIPLGNYSGVGLPAELIQCPDQSVFSVGNENIVCWEHAVLPASVSTGSALFDRSTYIGYAPVAGAGIPAYFVKIPYRWLTGFPPIVGTTSLDRKWSQLKRYFLDHVFAGRSMYSSAFASPSTVTANQKMTTGWQVVPTNPDAKSTMQMAGVEPLQTTVNPTITAAANVFQGINVSPSTADVPSALIQRESQDYQSETADIMFDVRYDPIGTTLNTLNQEWTYSQPSGLVGEIYGLGLEFQPGRDLKTKV